MLKHKNIKECIILITFFLIVISMYYLNIAIPCLFHEITNLYCPGCGVTRMFDALFHFNIYKAISYNLYVFSLLILFIIYLIICIIKRRFITINNKIIYVLIIIGLIFTILRNIPYFSYLAP